MSEAMSPVPKDAPVRIAWEAYKASDDYANTKKWAVVLAHTDGSLWAAFYAGFVAAQPPSPVKQENDDEESQGSQRL